MTVTVIDIESLEMSEEILDLLNEDAFEHDETIEQRIVNVLTEHYCGKV